MEPVSGNSENELWTRVRAAKYNYLENIDFSTTPKTVAVEAARMDHILSLSLSHFFSGEVIVRMSNKQLDQPISGARQYAVAS